MDFTETINKITVSGAVSFALQLSKHLGIFHTLRHANHPLTSQQVADAKKLKERYVREILGALTCVGAVQISINDAGEHVFALQLEAKEAIDKGALAKIGFLSSMTSLYSSLRGVCQRDGPNGYSYTEETFQYLEERLFCTVDKTLETFLQNTPGLTGRLEQGIQVIEFGSGTGLMISKLAIRFPQSTFTASEVNGSLIAKVKAKHGGIPNMQYDIIDLCQTTGFPETNKYDWGLANDVIHDLPHPLVGLKNIRKIIKEDGYFTFADKSSCGNPALLSGSEEAAFNYTVGIFHCIPEGYYQAEDSEAHGPTWSLETCVSKLHGAGFDERVIKLTDFDAVFICRCRQLEK